jgi:hypothetical protein
VRVIKGKFVRWSDEDETPAAGAVLEFTLSQDAWAIDGTGVKGDVPIRITLDDKGCIPKGTRVYSNDELETRNTYYTAFLHDNEPGANPFSEWLILEGRSPIDLKALVPLEKPLCQVEHVNLEPVALAEPFRPPVQREPGSTSNYNGFHAVSFHVPAVVGSTSLPSLDGGKFGLCRFHLPCKAVVASASIIVESAARDKHALVGLYNGGGKRVLTARISVGQSGDAVGYLEAPVCLEPGDYSLAFATDQSSSAVVRSLGNAIFAAVVSGGGGRELPQALGNTSSARDSAVPAVFFRS